MFKWINDSDHDTQLNSIVCCCYHDQKEEVFSHTMRNCQGFYFESLDPYIMCNIGFKSLVNLQRREALVQYDYRKVAWR